MHYCTMWRVLVLTLVVLATIPLPALALGAISNDVSQVHSLFPPMLQNYWMNGMQYWSFGRHTVVTDWAVHLTDTRSFSKGFLWNRHGSDMESFQLNVTLRMMHRHGSWLADGAGSGMGIWYASTEKYQYHSDSRFFGFQQHFQGIGVVLDHNDELSLILGTGEVALQPGKLQEQRAGGCRISGLGESHLTISLRYHAGAFTLRYTVHPGSEPAVEDLVEKNFIQCVTAESTHLNKTRLYYFGVTAGNTDTTQAAHSVHSIVMSPLSRKHAHQEEEQEARRVQLFERERLISYARARRGSPASRSQSQQD